MEGLRLYSFNFFFFDIDLVVLQKETVEPLGSRCHYKLQTITSRLKELMINR